MPDTTTWSDIVKHAHSAPMDFVMGFRHVVDRGFYCPPHFHPFLEIVYHPQGRGVTKISDEIEIPFREGSAVIYPTGTPHDQLMEHSGEDWCIQINCPPYAMLPTDALHVASIESSALTQEIRLLSQSYSGRLPNPKLLSDLRATAVLIDLLHIAGSRRKDTELSPSERHVRLAEKIIAEQFFKIDSLRQISEEMGIGYDHLRHLFKSRRKKSLVRYLNEVRTERARSLLSHSRIPLKQIAAMCGFRDEYYFSTVFKNFTGTAPGQYREQTRQTQTL